MRGAATVGGNLALARNRRLESDLAPLLLAAGARVTLASADGLRCAAGCRVYKMNAVCGLLLCDSYSSRVGSVCMSPLASWRGMKLAFRQLHAASACASCALAEQISNMWNQPCLHLLEQPVEYHGQRESKAWVAWLVSGMVRAAAYGS